MSNGKASLIAGMLAGTAGLLVFLVLHHLWIKPIWFILPLGLVIAVIGGLAVGWAYSELLPGLPARPWTILAWVALIGLTLLPSIVLAQLSPPLFTGTGENVTPTISVEQAVIIFVRNLLFTATVIGVVAPTGGIARTREILTVAWAETVPRVAVTVPAEALTGRLTWQTMLGAAALTAFLLVLARWVWKTGLRNYTGASA